MLGSRQFPSFFFFAAAHLAALPYFWGLAFRLFAAPGYKLPGAENKQENVARE